MTVKGHILLAEAISIPIITNITNDYLSQAIIFISIIFGATFPDIDEPNSYIGRKFPILSFSLKLFGLEHRTITHFLIFSLIFIIFGLISSDYYTKITLISFGFGVLLHDVGDMLTKGGIKGFFFPLLPNTTIRILPRSLAFYTNSAMEVILNIILFLIVVMELIYFFRSIF